MPKFITKSIDKIYKKWQNLFTQQSDEDDFKSNYGMVSSVSTEGSQNSGVCALKQCCDLIDSFMPETVKILVYNTRPLEFAIDNRGVLYLPIKEGLMTHYNYRREFDGGISWNKSLIESKESDVHEVIRSANRVLAEGRLDKILRSIYTYDKSLPENPSDDIKMEYAGMYADTIGRIIIDG